MNLQTTILSQLEDLKGTVMFQGLKIRIENPRGSVRSGKGWKVQMTYPYGEIVGTDGVDGDPIDCFIGPDKTAKFVHVVHTLKKDGSLDEDKCMLGFTSAQTAKAALLENYSSPTFYGGMDSMRMEEFKRRLKEVRENPRLIRAVGKLSVGDEVWVDGYRGMKGMVRERQGKRLIIQLHNNLVLSRDEVAVHPWDGSHISGMWKG